MVRWHHRLKGHEFEQPTLTSLHDYWKNTYKGGESLQEGVDGGRGIRRSGGNTEACVQYFTVFPEEESGLLLELTPAPHTPGYS